MTAATSTFTLALAMLLAIGTIRGGIVNIAKYVSVAGVPAFGYVFWASAVGAGLLLVVAAVRRRSPPLEWPYIRYYAVCATFGVVLPNALFIHVVKHVAAGSMAVVMTTVPLLTYFFALLLRIEPLNALRAAGIVTGFAGAVIMAWPAGGQSTELTFYLLLGFLCPTAYSITSIFASHASLPEKDALLLACGTLTAAAAVALPLAIGLGQLHPLWRSPGLPELLILAHGVLTATVFTLFFNLVRLAGPVFYSQSTYVIAITGIAWGMLIFDETHRASFWIATGFILCGLTLVNRQQRRLFSTPS